MGVSEGSEFPPLATKLAWSSNRYSHIEGMGYRYLVKCHSEILLFLFYNPD